MNTKKLFIFFFFLLSFNNYIKSSNSNIPLGEEEKSISNINNQYREIQKYRNFYYEALNKVNNIKETTKNYTTTELNNFIKNLEFLLEKINHQINDINTNLKQKLNLLYDFFTLNFNATKDNIINNEYNELTIQYDAADFYITQLKLKKINQKINENKLALKNKTISIDYYIHKFSFDFLYINELQDKDLLLSLETLENKIATITQELDHFQNIVEEEKLVIEKKNLESIISILEKKLKTFKTNIFTNKSIYENKKKFYYKENKKLIEQKNNFEKNLIELTSKYNLKNQFVDAEYFLNYILDNSNKRDVLNQSNNEIFIQNINNFIDINNIIIGIYMINIELFYYKKNMAIIDSLYLINQKEVSVNQLHNTLKETGYQSNKKNYLDYSLMIKKYIEELEIFFEIIQKHKIFIHQNLIDNMQKNYNNLKTLKKNLIKASCASKFLYKELQNKIFWSRSEKSIGLNKIKNCSFEIKLFIQELKNKFIPTIYNLYYHIYNIENINILQIIYLFIFIIFIIATSFIYKLLLRKLFTIIDKIEIQSYLIRKISLFINIISMQNILFFCWINLFFSVYLKIINYYYINTIFYLVSIPISILYTYTIIKMKYQKEDIQIHPNIEKIKYFIFNYLGLYSIIILFFFRLALMSLIYGNAHKIILIIQCIILQIELILFLKKKNIMQKITNFPLLNDNIKKHLANYYQLIILFFTLIILMSNPYVGYGNQVFYFFSRFLFSIILIPIWNFIFDFIKNNSMYIFFTFDEGEARGIMRNAKLLYFLFLLLFYFITATIIIYIILNFWGYNVDISFITNLIYKNLLPQNNNVQIAFSIYNMYTPIVYIFKGYIISYFINHLVLNKILNPIIIGQTMQNTIIILIRYIIITTFFILGLCIAGLESLIIKLGTLIVGLGFALKEPIADFICYFIILIQCPIKVGDLIRINCEGGGRDPEVTGTVRSIKGRTTIIRQKSGQTIIIPNSLIVKRTVFNWTYYKSGFISVEDFIVTVDRSVDIDTIRNLLFKTIEMHPALLKNPQPLVRCENITTLGYEFLIRGYISPDRAHEQWDIASQMRMLLIKKLQQENINFAIPSYKLYIANKNQADQEYLE